jgi:uroporphyrin-III C-methyltransferase
MRAELIGYTVKDTPDAGEAWIVGAGPGDPELITLRAQRLISRADVVVYDRLVSATVLDYARKEADLISVGKSSGKATLSQAEINELLVRLVRDGKRVCRLKGGDPFIFGRGGEEALALAAAGLTFQIVPGISAALGCAATAGIPLTLRGVSGSVTLATGLLDEDLLPDWPLLLNGGHTLCLYMSVGAIATMTDALISANVDPDLPVAIVENGTTSKQRTIFSSVSALKTDAERLRVQSPSMLFLGRSIATARDLQWYEGGSIAPAFSSSIELDPLAAIA